MNDFTASNGIGVSQHDDPKHWIVETLKRRFHLDPFEMQALREFFQAEEDERLGRWRWPEDPAITVRVAPRHAQRAGSNGGTVAIQQDSDGYIGYYDRESLPEITDLTGGIVRAGHAYFDAHPEPKPWHDAEPGEAWLLTVDGTEVAAVTYEGSPTFSGLRFEVPGRGPFGRHASAITAGRRIWPEVSA